MKTSRSDLAFAVVCALIYGVVAAALPRYTPLLEADSRGYLVFSPIRTALYPAFLAACRSIGLDLAQITWVQLAIFVVSLVYFLIVLQRNGFPRWLLAAMVGLLAVNVLYSSLHFSIMSEALYFPLGLVAVAFWVEYICRRRTSSLAGAGLSLGLMIGVRLAGVALLPLHLLLVIARRPVGLPLWLALIWAIVPPAVGAGVERLLYRAVHGGASATQAPNLLTGKAAMLVQPDMKFSGPHARSLENLARQLYAIYRPIQGFAAAAPSLALQVQLSAPYEGQAQYNILVDEFIEAAKREHTSEAVLRSELGKQVILQNLLGYLELTLLNDIGQWSIAAQRFPPNAKALAEYADANPGVLFDGRVPYELVHPAPSIAGYILYPVFLLSGGVTLVLALAFVVFLFRPALAAGPVGPPLLIACFLSATCHSYTLFISMVDEWTPRFLMAVFPQLEVIAACLLLVVFHRFRRSARSENVSPREVAAAR